MTLALVEGHWLPALDGDPRARTLYQRHYSASRAVRCSLATGRVPWFVGPGEKMVLLTADCRALFVWRRERHRLDRQRGIDCAVFRNEGPVLSSELIREADALAWAKWPGERLFTFVDPRRVRSTNPGYCFLQAGWRRCGRSKGGLVILEMMSEWRVPA